MAILATQDNVCEVSATVGVAAFVMGGAKMGAQSWMTAYPAGGVVYYYAAETTLLGTPGQMWELGIGTLSNGVLTRTSILASSNAGAAARFPGPATYISSTIPFSVLSAVQALANGTTGVTQAPGENTTLIATDAFVNAAVAVEASARATGDTNAIATAEAASLPANYFTPKVWTSGADLTLGIGQSATASFTAATSMPLHIASGDGQIYEIEIDGTYTSVAAAANSILEPNNAAHASAFTIYELVGSNVTPGAATAASTDSGFRLDNNGASIESAICTIFTSTLRKKCFTKSANASSTVAGIGHIHSRWQDTTTVWSSIGTVIVPNAWTGTITARRIA